jgi:hypothetical protein
MKERLMSFFLKLLMYGSMWMVALFPFQILIAAIYQVDYVYPDADTIGSLSSTYWGVILIPPVFAFLGRVAKAVLGDIWIDIQNEVGLLFYSATHGEVKKTITARIWGIVSFLFVVSCIAAEVWWFISSFLTYERAQVGVMILWAAATAAFMKRVQRSDEAD